MSQAHCRLMYRTTILPIDAITAISLVDLSMQDYTLEDTVDALHSTFLNYPDFDYLCTAKKLLTRMSLYDIWKEELFYYGKLLQIDHKTLENHIDSKNFQVFAKYDDVADDNIPLSATLVTSSYFSNKKNHDNNENKYKKDVDDKENSNAKVINDKLAVTLKKHSTLNKIEKELPNVNKRKKVTKRNRKEITIDTTSFGNKKEKKIPNTKRVKSDKKSKINVCPESEILKAVPSVNDIFTELGIDFKTVMDCDSGNEISENSKNDSTNEIDVDEDKNKNSSKKDDEKLLNKTANMLKQFEFTEKRDLNKFYDEKIDRNNLEQNKTTITTLTDIKNKNCSFLGNNKSSGSSSQIFMFESSDCDIDLDI